MFTKISENVRKAQEDRCKESDPNQSPFEIALGNRIVEHYNSYRDFILGIRDKFDNSDFAVRLTINGQRSSWIKVRASDLYVVSFNPADDAPQLNGNGWKDIPSDLINYPQTRLTLTVASIWGNLDTANKWSRNFPGSNLGHAQVVVLAFVISEAARFEAVYSSVDALLSFQFTSVEWLYFRGLIVSWQAISNTISPNRLVVPISMQYSLTFAQTQQLTELAGIIEELARIGYPEQDN
jgi:hypothetical protein